MIHATYAGVSWQRESAACQGLSIKVNSILISWPDLCTTVGWTEDISKWPEIFSWETERVNQRVFFFTFFVFLAEHLNTTTSVTEMCTHLFGHVGCKRVYTLSMQITVWLISTSPTCCFPLYPTMAPLAKAEKEKRKKVSVGGLALGRVLCFHYIGFGAFRSTGWDVF